MKKLNGIAASEGIAVAKIYKLKQEKLDVKKIKVLDYNGEIEKLNNALDQAQIQINDLKTKALKKLGQEKAEIFDAHLQILKDPELKNQILDKIKSEKINASFAFDFVAKNFQEIFLQMDDPYMKERASDVKDVSYRVLSILLGKKIKDLSLINNEVIILAHDLTPSQTSQLNAKFVKGFVTEIGGKTSHSAIMARTLQIPAIVGVGNKIFDLDDDKEILIDGKTGILIINPDKETKNLYKKQAERDLLLKQEELTFKQKISQSKDGWKTKIAANIGSPEDLNGYHKFGAEGIGLFRSEFLYMESDHWPTEEEQFLAYKKVLEEVKPNFTIIRTLDIGGDKTLKYYQFPKEMNPFLGYRAIRVQLDQKKLLITQIRALLRASYYGNLGINIPMIATINEFKEVKSIIKKVENDLIKEGKKIGQYKLGIMVEIPSAVILAEKFAKYVDYFSIGTNDLIQYTFAVDRMSKSVSYLYQPFNPAILESIKKVIDSSHKYGKWTAICGEMASEEKLAPLFVGMGLDEFSMSATAVLKIRRIISKIDKKDAEKLIEKVLNFETAEQVEDLLTKYLQKILN
ncbi:MAG: phosphoenolpyruvate-protein phosphotransferase [Candidatus Hepatoplasma scabrum]|nr:MAG: phosphoenolpyruvate-protein phosphotransferase [Candidatus Hepatoplasma sp.]